MQLLTNDMDWVLFYKMKRGDAKVIDEFYTKFAPIMFGCILEICKEKDLASEIFKKIFLNLTSVKVSKACSPFAFWLWRHTGSEAKNYLSENLNSASLEKQAKMIETICLNNLSRDAAADFFKINSKDVGGWVKKELQYPN